MRARRTAVAAIMMAATAVSLHAGEGRIPLYQPAVIAAPGHYVLTRDVAAPGTGGPVFDIQADGVTLSLNGHDVQCQPPDPCIVVGGNGGEARGIAISGGTVSGGMYGIRITNAEMRHVTLADLTITDATAAAVRVDDAGSFDARRIRVRGAMTGFDIQGPGAASGIVPCMRVADSLISAQTAVQCTDVRCDIRNNLIRMARSAIRLVNSKGSTATGNSILNCPVCFNPQPEPPARAVSVEQSANVRIQDNTLSGSPAPNGDNHGIYFDAMSPDAFVAGNSVTGFGDDGLHLMSSNSLALGNLINGNGGNGVWIGGADSIIDDGKITGNSGDGIVFEASGIVYRHNVLLGNNNPISGSGLADIVDGGGNVQ